MKPLQMQKLLRQAQQMQEQVQRELGETFAEASVGGGMVSVKMNGHKLLVSVSIDPEAVDPEDPAMLEDLVVAAVNEASRKVDDVVRERMAGLAGGLGLPGM